MTGGGVLADNVVHFARTLRAAGLRVGPAAVLDAIAALHVVDLGQREEVRACLSAVFVHHPDELPIFEQTFRLFFRAPRPAGLDELLSLLLPHSQVPGPQKSPVLRRVGEAMQPPQKPPPRPHEPPRPDEEPELDAALSFSARETVRHRDFAEMSATELAAVRRLIAGLRFAAEPVPIRRTRPAPDLLKRGPYLDVRRMLKKSLRSAALGGAIPLAFRVRRRVPPPLVVLCDISGSMARYTEMLLRFLHTLLRARRRTQTFVMGTQLTNVTRLLRGRDIDLALARCGQRVSDWGGGTRLYSCLREFNFRWARRVLSQSGGATVLLITDGLERDDAALLGQEADRLHRSCRRLIWLNPLLGFDGFAPLAAGIRALLPHVDEFRPVHNLESLEQLAAALSSPCPRRPFRPGQTAAGTAP